MNRETHLSLITYLLRIPHSALRLRVGCCLLHFAFCIAFLGCNNALKSTYDRDLAPTMDRLVAAYEDLASKRFQVVADFESPEQGSLFRMEPASGPAAVAISTERAKTETGVGSLHVSFADSSFRLIATDSANSKWALHRDWSKYHLLLVSVFSPRQLSGFSMSVKSGTDANLKYEHPRTVLVAGWNLLRIDLCDMMDQINLTDVRELQFWCDPLERSVDLYIDDIILVDNARYVFASKEAEPGDLYVRAEGRRLAVGAVDRFELVFSRGRLRQWFDLGHDVGRTHNLSGMGWIGPNPVVISNDSQGDMVVDGLSQWSGLGIAAEFSQTLIETTPLRVVVQGEIRFSSPEAPASESSPYHRWIYTVYRDGRIYVECRGTARAAQFEPGGMGIAFCCDGTFGFERWLTQTQPSGEAADAGASYALFSRSQPGQADLLVAPAVPSVPRALENPNDSRRCALWSMAGQAETFSAAALIRVWPVDIDSQTQARPMALDYQHPLPLILDAGRLVQTDSGDFNNDGYSEARGYYVLQLDGNIAKVRIDGVRYLRFSPIFKLVDVGQRDIWVYVDGRQIKEIHRDNDGNAFFEVPGIISREVLLEITSRTRETTTAN